MTAQGDILGRFAECKALAEHGEPLSPTETIEFNILRAREMARAEARRQPETPQLDLDIAA